MSKIYIPFLIR